MDENSVAGQSDPNRYPDFVFDTDISVVSKWHRIMA